MKHVVAYDIADDRRREDVATLLSGYGPRVQLSVFEYGFGTRLETGSVQGKLRDLIGPVEDQVRLYPLDERAACRVAVIGADDRGTPGLLDHHTSRYTGRSKRSFPASVSAPESAGQRLGCAWVAENGHIFALPPGGQRNGHQTRRSRAPPEGIRRNDQPDTEGIETYQCLANSRPAR